MNENKNMSLLNEYLWTVTQGLIWCYHYVGCHEECSILSWRNHVVRLVPDPLVQHPQAGRQLLPHIGVQLGDGVAFHLQYQTEYQSSQSTELQVFLKLF